MAKIKTEKVKGKDLKAGDLFSCLDQKGWDEYMKIGVGSKVFVRTNTPCPENQVEEEIYRITIIKD